MKKLTKKRKNWLTQQVKTRWRASVFAANMKRRDRCRKPLRLQCCVILVPRLLIAENIGQRQQILGVIQQVENKLGSQRFRVKLDFSQVAKIYPGGMLVLFAAMQRLVGQYPGRLSASCPPHSLASQLFNHFGLAKAFGISLQLSRPEHPSVLGWSYLTGNQAQGAEVKALLDNYRKNTRAEVPDGLFPVLTEAMTNVRQHAYTDDLTTPVDLQRWWLFARHEKPGGDAPESLYIAIYDIGYGIPATMRNQLNTPEKIVGFLDKAGKASTLTHGTALDQRLLYAAVEDKRSQTGHPYRGNGLPEMREFVADSTNGRLHIVSGLAQYSFVQGQTDGQTEGFKQKFPGTLLLWGLVLKTKEISP